MLPNSRFIRACTCFKEGIIKPDAITIDAKTGVSGAGRNGTIQNLFTELTENIKAYKVGQHQHIPEIEQTMVDLSQSPANISFITHLVPMSRGILSTMYCDLTKSITTEEVHAIYKAMYQNDAFIRIRPIGQFPATKEVTGSNYCDIGLLVDERTNKLIVVSAIDNLVKGAAGQAIQNMNIINGWQENTGLQNLPLYP